MRLRRGERRLGFLIAVTSASLSASLSALLPAPAPATNRDAKVATSVADRPPQEA
jgi:hypothetical protein